MSDQDEQPDSLPRAGDVIQEKYRIQGVLGRGGMGAVYSAVHEVTGKLVALKWLLPEQATDEARARLIREARAASSVQHPNVVDIYDVSEQDGGLFIVMECLRGQTLAELYEVQLQVPPEELLRVLIPAMRGVHAAHRAGIVHRDLKPENIILARLDDGGIEPKVVDFGISKMPEPGQIADKGLTSAGVIIGTPHYMALEQINGSGTADVRSDVYAFGVLLFEGLTGRLPFDAEKIGDLALRIATQRTPLLRDVRPDLPEGLEAVIRRAMSRDPKERYGDVQELATALEPFAGGVSFLRDSGSASAPAIAARATDQSQIDTEKMSQGRRSLAASVVPDSPAGRAAVAAALVLVALAGVGLWWGSESSARAVQAPPEQPAVPAAVQQPPAEPVAIEVPDVEPEAVSPLAPAPQAVEPEAASVEPATPPPAPAEERRAERRRRKRSERRAPVVRETVEPAKPARVRGHRTPGMSADEF